MGKIKWIVLVMAMLLPVAIAEAEVTQGVSFDLGNVWQCDPVNETLSTTPLYPGDGSVWLSWWPIMNTDGYTFYSSHGGYPCGVVLRYTSPAVPVTSASIRISRAYISLSANAKSAIAVSTDGINYTDIYTEIGPGGVWGGSIGPINTGDLGGASEVYVKIYTADLGGGAGFFAVWAFDAIPPVTFYGIDGIAPSVNAGNDVLAIPGDDVGLSAVISDNLPGPITCVWTGASVTADPVDTSKATVSVPEAYFDEDITVTATDACGNSASDTVRVREIGSYIGSMLPPGLNKIMERGGVGN